MTMDMDLIVDLYFKYADALHAARQAQAAMLAGGRMRPRLDDAEAEISYLLIRELRPPANARGKRGVVHRLHGVHVFPDTHAHGGGESPQPLYSVAFAAGELWGEAAEPNQQVHIDLWESYLEPGR